MIRFTNGQLLAVLAVAVLLGFWAFRKGGEWASVALNPTHHDNLANRAFEDWYAGVTDGQGSPGSDLYDAVGWLEAYHPVTLGQKARQAFAEWWND